MDLFARQRVLREIGDQGQERLASETFAPSSSLSLAAQDFARVYARAAGWGLSGPPRTATSHPFSRHFRHAAAAEVGLAAADVLAQSLTHFDLSPTHL